MHRLIIERAFTHAELPGGLARLEVPFEQLLAQADGTGKAARAKPHKSRPRVGVKRQLRDRLLRETFQRYDDVARALGMAGRRKAWEAIGKQLVPTVAPVQIKERLNRIVDRRNQIVHEGDYRRLERPRGASRNPIGTPQTRRDIGFLADLIDAIHVIV